MVSRKLRFAKIPAVLSLLVLGSLTHAQSSTSSGLESFAFSGVTNNINGTFENVSFIESQFSDTGAFVSQAGAGEFGGVDSSGNSATMRFTTQSSATAQFGILRSQASASLENPFYNSENPAYVDADGNINTAGTPDRFLSVGQARFFDRFEFSNLSTNQNVRVDFWYRVKGTLSGEAAFISLFVENDDDSDLFIRQSNGTTQVVNEIWTTKKFTVGADFKIDHSATLLSQFDNGSTESWPEGVTQQGSAAFGNTIYVERINLYDSDDNFLTGWTVNTDSGTDYSAVPEPATLAVLAVGAIALRRRRRK